MRHFSWAGTLWGHCKIQRIAEQTPHTCLLCGIILTKCLFSEISFFLAPFISVYQFCIASANKESLCFGFPFSLSIFQLLFSLYQLRKLWERRSKVLRPILKKSHTLPNTKNLKYVSNSHIATLAYRKIDVLNFSRLQNNLEMAVALRRTAWTVDSNWINILAGVVTTATIWHIHCD